MSYELGTNLKIGIFGGSHEPLIGVTAQGLPAGEQIDLEELQAFLRRRAPGDSPFTTKRSEPDIPEFLSGMDGGVLTGEKLEAVIRNTGQRSGDYSPSSDTPRPSHADYTASVRYHGTMNMNGGGPFSGRMTAPLCIIGGIAKQILAHRGIRIGAHLYAVGTVLDEPFPLEPDGDLFRSVAAKELPVLSDSALEAMKEEILSAASEGDSVGGIVECAVTGFPAGIGGPLFDGIESKLSAALFGIPGVKGVGFGSGFSAPYFRGSEHNDPFIIRDGSVRTEANRSGGIQGGISNGMPLVFQLAMKPTPSIAKKQKTVSLSRMEETEIEIRGRHDPCIAVRAVPVAEAAAAVVLLDLLLGEE